MSKSLFIFKNNGDNFARVRHCSETPVTDHRTYMDWRFGNDKVGASDPACFKYPFKNETYLRSTLEMEDWWFDRLREASGNYMTPEQLETAWRNLVNPKKAFTNNRDLTVWGWRINGKPLRLEPIICTGATIKLIGPKYKKSDGFEYQNFEIIDFLKDDWKTMTIKSHPWLIQPATNSINIVGGERIDPFPKMNFDRMTPYFLWGLGTNQGTLRADWFEPVAMTSYPYKPFRVTGDVNRWYPDWSTLV